MLPRHAGGKIDLQGGTGKITGMISLGAFLETYKKDITFRIQSPENIDPEEINPNALWVTSPIENIGSENPIIARVLLQGHEILKTACFDKNVVTEQVVITLHQCKETLIACEKIYLKISEEIDKIIEKIESSGIERDNKGRGLNPFPQVIGLEHDCGSFLVYVNRTIKSICELPSLFVHLDRVDSNFDHLGKRLGDVYGDKSELTKFVISNADTIRYLIELRNYHEHPKSKKTIIRNFQLLPDSNINVPTWEVTGHPQQAIHTEMKAIIDFLVQVTESMLIHLVMSTISSNFPWIIQKIDAANIDPDNPKHFKLTLDILPPAPKK